MSVRDFDGVDDQLVVDDGTTGAVFNGAHSIVFLCKPLTLNNNDRFYFQGKSTGTGTGSNLGGFYQNSATNVTYGSDSADSDANLGTTSDWLILGWSKASGTVAPRGHCKVLGSGSWTHANGGTTAANVATDPGSFVIGSLGGSLYMHVRVAVVAFFTTELSDANFESIQTTPSTAQLSDLGAVAIWELNQASTATAVEDLIGTADQVSLTGTTVVEGDDPSGWTFGLAAAAAPGVQRTFNPIPFMGGR